MDDLHNDAKSSTERRLTSYYCAVTLISMVDTFYLFYIFLLGMI